jgi:hypothetical protein
LRTLRRFFFSSPPSAVFLAVAVFFAALGLDSVVVFAGALDAVDAGALPAVELGFGAIAIEVVEAESEREEGARVVGGREELRAVVVVSPQALIRGAC